MKRFGNSLLNWIDRAVLAVMGEHTDWSDPRNAPPAFEEVEPHPYKPAAELPCCALCGGGSKNPIHQAHNG